jgi:hypothetical protein
MSMTQTSLLFTIGLAVFAITTWWSYRRITGRRRHLRAVMTGLLGTTLIAMAAIVVLTVIVNFTGE